MKTYIRTFDKNHVKINDLKLDGGQDNRIVVLFCLRRAVDCGGHAVVITQDAHIPDAISDAFLDGYLGQGGYPINDLCTVGEDWFQVRVYSEGAAERASETDVDDVSEDAWDLAQHVDYFENMASYYAEDVGGAK